MPIKNDWVKEKKRKMNINLDYKKDNNIFGKFFIIILFAIGTYILFETYNYFEEKKEKNKILEQQIREYNEQIIEQERIKTEELKREKTNQQTENYNIKISNGNYNKNYGSSKSFKISTEIISGQYNRGISIIERNLQKVKSRGDDSNYQIEIVGYISEYGNFFYNINKRKPSNEYDIYFINILNQLKQLKYSKEDETVNFKIYIDNNDNDLN